MKEAGEKVKKRIREPVSVYTAKNYHILYSIVLYQHSRLTKSGHWNQGTALVVITRQNCHNL